MHARALHNQTATELVVAVQYSLNGLWIVFFVQDQEWSYVLQWVIIVALLCCLLHIYRTIQMILFTDTISHHMDAQGNATEQNPMTSPDLTLTAQRYPVASQAALMAYYVAFSVYTGWVSAATILGTSILLKRTQLHTFTDHTSEEVWTVVIAVVAFFIFAFTSVWFCDPIYGLVFCWVCIWSAVKQGGAVAVTFIVLGICNVLVQAMNATRCWLRR